MAGIVYVHYLAPDDGGPIVSKRRVETQGSQEAVISPGMACRIACNPTRKTLGVSRGKGRNLTLVSPEYAFATGQMFREAVAQGGKVVLQELVTCPKCRASKLYKRDEAEQRGMWSPPLQKKEQAV